MQYVFLAGIGNSEPGHWQAVWHGELGGRWVEHADWERPRRDEWVAELHQVLRDVSGPKVLVAHSLGCLLAAEWAARHSDPEVKGSFLVAPPDVNGPRFPSGIVGFAPALAAARPPTPARVVASTNDPFATFESACAAAAAWGADIVDVGALGHINLASNLGGWAAGRRLLERFVAGLAEPP
jgi:predicted alpha/beta hydrolase family esterase